MPDDVSAPFLPINHTDSSLQPGWAIHSPSKTYSSTSNQSVIDGLISNYIYARRLWKKMWNGWLHDAVSASSVIIMLFNYFSPFFFYLFLFSILFLSAISLWLHSKALIKTFSGLSRRLSIISCVYSGSMSFFLFCLRRMALSAVPLKAKSCFRPNFFFFFFFLSSLLAFCSRPFFAGVFSVHDFGVYIYIYAALC